MLPKPLYEALPYLYITIAVLSVTLIESRASVIPATILLAAAGMVLMMRHNGRSASRR